MAKKDDIILIIAKAFSKETFTKEETKISKDLTVMTLVTEYGLNDIQAKEVIKWCVISCASLPIESEVLKENFLGRFFSRNKKKNTRSQQEINDLVYQQINISLDFDDNVMCTFLNSANKFRNKIEAEGLYREEVGPTKKVDSYDSMIDMAIDKKPYSHNKSIPEGYLKGLHQLLNRIDSLIQALDRLPLPQSAKNESFALSSKDLYRREPKAKKQISDLLYLTNNIEFTNAIGEDTDHIKHQVLVKNFLRFLENLIKPVNNKEKIKIIIASKKYIKELYYDIEKIVKIESEVDTHSHSTSY